MEQVIIKIEKSNSGYSAHLPELPGCVSTASTIDEIKANIAEAISFHLEGMVEDRLPIPSQFKKQYNLQYSFDVETFLNYYNHIFTRRALSKLTGINESLLSQYAAGLKHPRPAQSKKIEMGLHQLANELLQITL